MVRIEDFAAVTYDSLADAARSSNLVYREMAFNPTKPSSAPPARLARGDQGRDRPGDHGYAVLLDENLFAAQSRQRVRYATCWSTSVFHTPPGTPSPIGAMIAAGLDVSISSDDPPYFGTDLGQELVPAGAELGWSPADARARVLAAVEACPPQAGRRSAPRPGPRHARCLTSPSGDLKPSSTSASPRRLELRAMEEDLPCSTSCSTSSARDGSPCATAPAQTSTGGS